MSNYDSEIQTRVRGINRKHTEHQKRVGRGMTNLQTEDQIVDLSNLQDIQPSAETGRKIMGAGISRKIGCGHSGGPVVGKKKIVKKLKGKGADPSFNPKPEDYLNKNQLDAMTKQDRINFKDHPDWWGVYKPVQQNIPPAVYATLTAKEKANLKIHPDWIYGDEPTGSNRTPDSAMGAQLWYLNENNKAQDTRDKNNFDRDVQERQKEAEANEPSTWDTIFGIAKAVVPMVIGLGKPKKTIKSKGKAPTNPWITHVKTYALNNKINYRDALKDPKCKQSYKK